MKPKDNLNTKLVDLVNELYRSFYFFNEHFCKNKLNEPLITIQGDKRKGSTYGWFGKDFWEDNTTDQPKKISEINLTAESLYREPSQVLETLIHEMAHLKNAQNGIPDCTKTQYHNDKFKKTAEEMGLVVSKIKGKGWASTALGEKAKLAIDLLVPNASVYKITRKPPEKVQPEPKTIGLSVDISYENKVEELVSHYGKKRTMTETAIDLLYNKLMEEENEDNH